MMFLWAVKVNGITHAIVPSISEQAAIELFYIKQGGASRYSGIAHDSITATRV